MPPDQVKPLLEWAAAQLAASGSGTPQLDARLLLQHVARLSREDLILDPARALSANDKQAFLAVVARRAAREPVSRIIGQREFYGRSFRVTPDVLDPRPDTETLVDAALNLKPPFRTVLDLGTGSGAIIATLLAERPKASGVAVDVSPVALEVAQANAQSLGIADRLTSPDPEVWQLVCSGDGPLRPDRFKPALHPKA
jgi:release factor glutamine methyltransferase